MSSDGTVVIPVAKELKTETEIKLSKLIQQRDQLMGDRNGVQRRTRVGYLPLPFPIIFVGFTSSPI